MFGAKCGGAKALPALPLALALRLQGVQGCVPKQHIAKWCINMEKNKF